MDQAACQRHQDDLKDGDKRGLYFDQEEGQRFVAFFERFLHHSKGQWAGQPFTLLPWQQFMISSLFGWKRADGTRRFRTLFCAVGRRMARALCALAWDWLCWTLIRSQGLRCIGQLSRGTRPGSAMWRLRGW